VERLGEMTPEDLQEIPGIGPKMVEKIRLAVNNYYMQFEEGAAVEAAPELPAKGVAPNAELESAEESPVPPEESASSELPGEMVSPPEEEEPTP
jgi:N utilization substance protein A